MHCATLLPTLTETTAKLFYAMKVHQLILQEHRKFHVIADSVK